MSLHDEHAQRSQRAAIDLTSEGLARTLANAERRVVEPPPTLRLRQVPRDVRDWAVFQPNAPGRGELRGAEALRARQLMKGRSQYLAERVLVVVGRDSAALWHLLPGGVAGRCVGWWPIGGLVAQPVPAIGVDDPWPAAALVDVAAQRVMGELRGIRADLHSFRVLSALTER